VLDLLDAAQDGGLRFLDAREREETLPWPAVRARAKAAAASLQVAGVRAGDRVAIILPTGPAFFDAFFGALYAGATPVPLYPPVRLGRLDEYHERTAALMARSQIRLLVTEPRIKRLLGQTMVLYKPALGVLDKLPSKTGEPAPTGVQSSDLALVQFSSGTTVAPKPVGLTHEQLLANSDTITGIILGLSSDPSYKPSGVSWLPLYHDMGLIGCVFPALRTQRWLTLIPPEIFLTRPWLWLRALSKYGGTISPAPNFAYNLCLERVRDEHLEGVDLSRWRMALNGAEPVSAETLRKFEERFGPYGFRKDAFMPVYGLSEMALAVTMPPAGKPWSAQRFSADSIAQGRAEAGDDIELVTVGSPMNGFGVEIRSPEGAVDDGVIGTIFVRGPSRMNGYLDRIEQPFDGAWLDTGDLGFVRDNQLFITGRGKDVIILRGRNHAPHDLERAVDAVDGVRTGCAAAVGEITGDGERVLVFVEVRTPQDGQADACQRAIQAATGIRPDLIVLLEPGTLPRTSSGKIRRGETLRRWQAGELTPPSKVTALHVAGAFAKSALGWLRAR